MSISFHTRLRDASWYQTLRGWSALLVLTLLAILHIPVLLLLERFLVRDERGVLWMRVAQTLVRLYLWIAGVNVELVGSLKNIPCPTIYAGNHLTGMDGLILNVLLGPRVVLLTAPFSMFAFPFSFWFKKGGMIEISRDEYDAAHFKGGEDRKAALEALLKKLSDGACVLIFPEGHYEKTEQLHYIHTGVARVAIRSKCPVQLLTTTCRHRLFLPHYRIRPGVMKMTIGPVLTPPSVSNALPFHQATLQLRDQILKGFEAMLPPAYLPNYLTQARQEIVAAFFDLDQTIYKHFSQKDFFKFLIQHHQVSQSEIMRFFSLSCLREMGILDDHTLTRHCYQIFSGWPREIVHQLSETFYQEVIPGHLTNLALPFIKDHQEAGHQLVLVTAVPHPLSQLFAHHFQMKSLDTELEVKDGCYTGRVVCFMDGKEKVRAMKKYALEHHVDLDKSYAYADSWSDYGMLHCVRYPVAVHPDHLLRRKAEEKKWKILT